VGDARDRARIDQIIAQVRPNVIFHAAAQRSPALAEADVHRTVTTNVLGTRNVLAAAAAAGVAQVVCAPTGRRRRPAGRLVHRLLHSIGARIGAPATRLPGRQAA
jgi:FlaA1/EpsC-like NDP-sugar epimerase